MLVLGDYCKFVSIRESIIDMDTNIMSISRYYSVEDSTNDNIDAVYIETNYAEDKGQEYNDIYVKIDTKDKKESMETSFKEKGSIVHPFKYLELMSAYQYKLDSEENAPCIHTYDNSSSKSDTDFSISKLVSPKSGGNFSFTLYFDKSMSVIDNGTYMLGKSEDGDMSEEYYVLGNIVYRIAIDESDNKYNMKIEKFIISSTSTVDEIYFEDFIPAEKCISNSLTELCLNPTNIITNMQSSSSDSCISIEYDSRGVTIDDNYGGVVRVESYGYDHGNNDDDDDTLEITSFHKLYFDGFNPINDMNPNYWALDKLEITEDKKSAIFTRTVVKFEDIKLMNQLMDIISSTDPEIKLFEDFCFDDYYYGGIKQ